jgi:hypothetical protein
VEKNHFVSEDLVDVVDFIEKEDVCEEGLLTNEESIFSHSDVVEGLRISTQ